MSNEEEVPILDITFKARFWAKVDRGRPNQCWNWTGGTKKGTNSAAHGRYGNIKLTKSRKTIAAHRAALIISGQLPTKDKNFACHSCDNSLCCNPAHLRWDNHEGNVKDIVERIIPTHKRWNPPE